jgi:hypothetical protein
MRVNTSIDVDVNTDTNAQNFWVSGLCPSFKILNTLKHKLSETGKI